MQEAIHVVCCCWAQRRPPPSLQDPLCEKKTMVVGGGKGGVVDDPIWEGGRKRNEEGAGISAGNCLGAREENYKIQYSTSSAMSNYSKCGCASFLFVCGEAQTMEWVVLLSYLGTVVGGRRGIESVQQGGHIFWLQGGGTLGFKSFAPGLLKPLRNNLQYMECGMSRAPQMIQEGKVYEKQGPAFLLSTNTPFFC